MGKRAEQNIAGLLAILMRGGMEYGAYKSRKKKEERAEEIRAEEAKATEAKLAREAEQEEYRRTQYQGQLQRQMEDAGRKQAYAPPRERFQNPAAMAGREPPMQGFAQFADQPGKWWEQLAPKPSAEEEAMASADILLKVIDKMNQGAEPGFTFTGTSFQPKPGYGQEAGGDVLGLKPVDWDRFYDNATKMTYAKYGISEGATPPNLDWDTINAEIMDTARTLAEPFLGDPLQDPASAETRATAREVAIAWAEGDPDTLAALPELQQQYPAVYALAVKYKADLDTIERAETPIPSGLGVGFSGASGMATAGSSYQVPPPPEQPGRGWRTIEEILGG